MNTYYLDDVIEIGMNTSGMQGNTIYTYKIFRYLMESDTYHPIPLYIGQLFMPNNQIGIYVDVTEVMKMYKFNPEFIFNKITGSEMDEYDNGIYKISIYDTDGTTVLNEEEFIIRMLYRYPNRNTTDNIISPENTRIAELQILEEELIPRIPYISTSNFYFPTAAYATRALDGSVEFEILSDEIEFDGSKYLSYSNGGYVMYNNRTLAELFQDSTIEEGAKEAKLYYNLNSGTKRVTFNVYAEGLNEGADENAAYAFLEETMAAEEAEEKLESIKRGEMTLLATFGILRQAQDYHERASVFFDSSIETNVVKTKKVIANVDVCPKRFYLMWQSRCGGFNIQPFEGVEEYSESITTVSVQQYINKERKIHFAVEPKWKLRTGWLTDDEYPFYESIFVSPFLGLYDSVEDRYYTVLLTDTTYTEKKWENQHSLYNLEINVKENKKQHIFN